MASDARRILLVEDEKAIRDAVAAYLEREGYWVVGADRENAQDYRTASYDVPLVLVIGSEGFGLRPLVKKQCDYFVSLPMVGKVNSLNASVACAILLYKIYEQRNPL